MNFVSMPVIIGALNNTHAGHGDDHDRHAFQHGRLAGGIPRVAQGCILLIRNVRTNVGETVGVLQKSFCNSVSVPCMFLQ